MKKLAHFFYILFNHRKIIKQLKTELLKPAEIRIEEMIIKNGNINAILSCPVFRAISETMVELLKVAKAPNYLEVTFETTDGNYNLLIQKASGETPAQQNIRLKKEIESLREEKLI